MRERAHLLAGEISIEGAEGQGTVVTLRVPTPLDDEQRTRLLTIAGKCPVHRALRGETDVTISDRIEPG